MKYVYHEGIQKDKKRSKIWWGVPVFGIVAGSYLLINTFAPTISTPFDAPADATAKKLTAQKPVYTENRLYIPQINVDIAIVKGDTEAVLELGAWNRMPENGNPIEGGNYVLSAHRFNLGWTPTQTKIKSPFYRIDKLVEGDQIYVDYEGVRYAYSITKRYSVDRTATEIEQRSDESKLTLYSCDLRGEKAGREVIEATPIGTIAWSDGAPKLKSL